MNNPLHFKPDGVARHPSTIAALKHLYVRDRVGTARRVLVYAECEKLGFAMADLLPEGPDLTLALRDLISARDNFLRALVE